MDNLLKLSLNYIKDYTTIDFTYDPADEDDIIPDFRPDLNKQIDKIIELSKQIINEKEQSYNPTSAGKEGKE